MECFSSAEFFLGNGKPRRIIRPAKEKTVRIDSIPGCQYTVEVVRTGSVIIARVIDIEPGSRGKIRKCPALEILRGEQEILKVWNKLKGECKGL